MQSSHLDISLNLPCKRSPLTSSATFLFPVVPSRNLPFPFAPILNLRFPFTPILDPPLAYT